MNVDYPAAVPVGKGAAEYAHVARENNETDAALLKQRDHLLLSLRLPGALLFRYDRGGYSRLLRARQRVCAGLVLYDQRYMSALYDTVPLRVDKCLQIGAAARDENGNVYSVIHYCVTCVLSALSRRRLFGARAPRRRYYAPALLLSVLLSYSRTALFCR